MAQTHFLGLPNKDLISSFSFNYYGTRLAVSSLDHHIYILSSDLETGKWPEDQSHLEQQTQAKTPSIQAWTAHEGPVIKVIWSDPIHGEILASAGTDGTVRIWEEDTRRLDQSNGTRTRNLARPQASKTQLYRLEDASISTDHHLRVYECLETNSFSSDNWNLIINIDLSVLSNQPTNLSDHLNIHICSNNFNLINPLSGIRSSSTPTHPSPFNQNTINNVSASPFSEQHLESFGAWSLSWCPESYWGDILAASSGSSGLIRLFKFSAHSQWENFGVLNPTSHLKSSSSTTLQDPNNTLNSPRQNHPSGPTSSLNASGPGTSSSTLTSSSSVSPISSLAWAPPCGRDYHLIAAGHRDGRARIWKLIPPSSSSASNQWSFILDTELEDHVHHPDTSIIDHNSTPQLNKNISNNVNSSSNGIGQPVAAGGGVGKCEWNVTGTVLSTSGSDGKVRIWKMGYTSRWVNTAEINCIDHDSQAQSQSHLDHHHHHQSSTHHNHLSSTGIVNLG
ncbi:hypothetical protein H4Q26_013652 [Puccinia striiformis f. sp. tritici PST-130]|nr:hypothetical protein H4Q26_013652 [Puccinia striiformis f. sp. tritici PST-130]